MLDPQRLSVITHEEKPVAAPGDVAGHRAMPCNQNRDRAPIAPGGHVVHGDLTVSVQFGPHHTHWRVDVMFARCDAAQPGQRGHHANSAVTAHAQRAHIVEVDNAGDAVRSRAGR